jgi:hypothetical protein
MDKEHYGAFRKARNIARTTRSRQPLHFAIAMPPRSIQITESIDFRCA